MPNNENEFEIPSEEEIRQKLRKEDEAKKSRIIGLIAIFIAIAVLATFFYLKNRPSTKTTAEQYIEKIANSEK